MYQHLRTERKENNKTVMMDDVLSDIRVFAETEIKRMYRKANN